MSKQTRADGSTLSHLQIAESVWDPLMKRSRVHIVYNCEQAWCQLKSGLRLRPVYHRVAHRIHAHIALSVMGLLLERMAEQACGDTWRNIRDNLKQIQLVQLSGPNGRLWQVTEPREGARKRLKALQIKAPPTFLKLA